MPLGVPNRAYEPWLFQIRPGSQTVFSFDNSPPISIYVRAYDADRLKPRKSFPIYYLSTIIVDPLATRQVRAFSTPQKVMGNFTTLAVADPSAIPPEVMMAPIAGY